MHKPVNLGSHLNSRVATYDTDRARGMLNAWGNSFPAEELPFDGQLKVASIPFQMSKNPTTGYDNVEPLGQEIELPLASVRGIALLCCGEMGDQYVTVRLLGPSGPPIEVVVFARGAMIPADRTVDEDGFAFSHLHYPGDYDLAMVRSAVWRSGYCWLRALPVTRIRLGCNPLFHILALTLMLGPSG